MLFWKPEWARRSGGKTWNRRRSAAGETTFCDKGGPNYNDINHWMSRTVSDRFLYWQKEVEQ